MQSRNQIPYPPGGRPTNWRTVVPKKLSHCCEGSRSHIRLLSLGIWQRDWRSQGIRLWSSGGFDYRTSVELGETKMPLLEDINKTLYAPGPRGKEQWLRMRLSQICLSLVTLMMSIHRLLWVGTFKASSEVQTHWIYKKWLCIPYTDCIACPSGK